jgi:two-component system OmpR family sensor kinase
LWPITAGILASLLFSALLAWYLSKPIRSLRTALGAAAKGDLAIRIAARMGRRRDELADLGREYDHMADRLRALMEAQRRLLHDVSHELRSPLARLQAAIGLARQDPTKMEATLERVERESVRLDDLVGELLTLSRLEAGTEGALQETVDLVELAEAIAEDARFEARAAGRELRFQGEGQALTKVNGELLSRAFENVIRNGVKFTPEDSVVEVVAKLDGDGRHFHLVVMDRGPGVPEKDLDAIFEPFYRGRNGQSVSGYGLGLAIAIRAVEAHGGWVRARNRDGGGLVVEVNVPLHPA